MKLFTVALVLALVAGAPTASSAPVAIVDNLSSSPAGFILVESPPSDQRVAQGFRTDGKSYQVTGGAVRVARSASSVGMPYALIFTVDGAGLPGASVGELSFGPIATSFTSVPLQPVAPIYLSANNEYLLILGYSGASSSYIWDITAASANVGAGPVTARTLVRTSAFPWQPFSQARDALLRLDGVVVPEPATAATLAIGAAVVAAGRPRLSRRDRARLSR